MPRDPTDGYRLVELQFCDGAPPTLGYRTRLPASSLFARENRHSEISLIWRELGDGFAPLTVASRHAPLLLELIHSPVPPHRRECAVHSSQERRLILPESDPEWLGSSGTCATIKGGTTIERDTARRSKPGWPIIAEKGRNSLQSLQRLAVGLLHWRVRRIYWRLSRCGDPAKTQIGDSQTD
jgi:hypothetical protein